MGESHAPSERPSNVAPLWLEVAFVALGALAVFRRLTPINDPDYFWHLHTGRYILEHGTIPSTDPFSHTFAGKPWMFVDWAADVLLYGVWAAGGHAAVIVACALIGALTCALGLWAARRSGGARAPIPELLIGLLVVIAVLPRCTPRPQLFSFLFLAIELALVEAAERDERWLLGIPLAIAVWQNMHASGTLGVLVLGLVAAARVLERRGAPLAARISRPLAASVVLAPLALLATVRPLDRLTAALEHASDAEMGKLVTEWAPFWVVGYRAPSGVAFVVLTILGALGAIAAVRARRRLDRVLISLVLAALAVKANRFIPFAALALAGPALEGLETLRRRLPSRARAGAGLLAAAGCAALLAWQAPPLSLGLIEGAYPEGAARFMREHPPKGKMFNTFRFGGYLLFELEGAYPVFIDGRSFALYGLEFTQKVTTADIPALAEMLERYDIGFAALWNSNAHMRWLQGRKDWSLVYFDDIAFIAVRNDQNPALAESNGYRVLHPAQWPADIEALKAHPELAAQAGAEASRAQSDAPDSALAHLLGVAVALGRHDLEEADQEVEAALALKPDYAPAIGAKLMICSERGDGACACRESDHLLETDARNAFALSLKKRFACP